MRCIDSNLQIITKYVYDILLSWSACFVNETRFIHNDIWRPQVEMYETKRQQLQSRLSSADEDVVSLQGQLQAARLQAQRETHWQTETESDRRMRHSKILATELRREIGLKK